MTEILKKVAYNGAAASEEFSGNTAQADCEKAYYGLVDIVEKSNRDSDYRYAYVLNSAAKTVRAAVFRDGLVFDFSYADFVAFADDKCADVMKEYKGVIFRLDRIDWRSGKCVLKVCTGYWNAGDKIKASLTDIDLADNVFHVDPDTLEVVALHNPVLNTRVNKKDVFVDESGHLMFDMNTLMQNHFDYARKETK